MDDAIKGLMEKLELRVPVKIELLNGKDVKPEIIAHKGQVEILVDEESYRQDIAEYLAKAKLAEKDPLLVTFYGQKNITEEESRHFISFQRLCEPLISAWAYGVLRRMAPEIYRKYIDEILANWEHIKNDPGMSSWDKIAIYALIMEDPGNDVAIHVMSEHQRDWDRYLRHLTMHIHDEPDTKHFLDLAENSGADYTVKINDEDGFRYYDVRAKARK